MAMTSVPFDVLEAYVAAVLAGQPIPAETGDPALDRALTALAAPDHREQGEDAYPLGYCE